MQHSCDAVLWGDLRSSGNALHVPVQTKARTCWICVSLNLRPDFRKSSPSIVRKFVHEVHSLLFSKTCRWLCQLSHPCRAECCQPGQTGLVGIRQTKMKSKPKCRDLKLKLPIPKGGIISRSVFARKVAVVHVSGNALNLQDHGTCRCSTSAVCLFVPKITSSSDPTSWRSSKNSSTLTTLPLWTGNLLRSLTQLGKGCSLP